MPEALIVERIENTVLFTVPEEKTNERKTLEIDGSVSPTGGMRLYN
jgi:hypothetical protein